MHQRRPNQGEAVLKTLFASLLFIPCSLLIAQQSMNNDSVIKLCKAGLSDDLIVSTITAAPGNYDLSADAIIALKTGGASEKVISTIIQKASVSAEKSPSAAPGSAGPSKNETVASSASQGEPPETGTVTASGPIGVGSRVVIAPMGGFETYFAAAVREKKVPITLTLDKASAQFFVVSTNAEWQGFVYGSGGSASWTNNGGHAAYGSAASSTRGLEASIMLIDARTKDVVWAYEVHKNSHGALIFGTFGARGQQSIAEACAKHFKEYVEKGK
jgi:hypothetical protein